MLNDCSIIRARIDELGEINALYETARYGQFILPVRYERSWKKDITGWLLSIFSLLKHWFRNGECCQEKETAKWNRQREHQPINPLCGCWLKIVIVS